MPASVWPSGVERRETWAAGKPGHLALGWVDCRRRPAEVTEPGGDGKDPLAVLEVAVGEVDGKDGCGCRWRGGFRLWAAGRCSAPKKGGRRPRRVCSAARAPLPVFFSIFSAAKYRATPAQAPSTGTRYRYKGKRGSHTRSPPTPALEGTWEQATASGHGATQGPSERMSLAWCGHHPVQRIPLCNFQRAAPLVRGLFLRLLLRFQVAGWPQMLLLQIIIKKRLRHSAQSGLVAGCSGGTRDPRRDRVELKALLPAAPPARATPRVRRRHVSVGAVFPKRPPRRPLR